MAILQYFDSAYVTEIACLIKGRDGHNSPLQVFQK